MKDLRPTTTADLSAESVGAILPMLENWVPVWTPPGAENAALWATDGTAEGTRLMSDLFSQSYPPEAGRLVCRSGRTMYFTKNVGEQNGFELWKSDGTASGTTVVAAWPRFWYAPYENSEKDCEARTVGGRMLFWVRHFVDWTIYGELWSTDGTSEGTAFVMALGQSPSFYDFIRGFAVFQGRFYFGMWESLHGGAIWTSDGTAAGTSIFFDSVQPDFFRAFGERLYFTYGGGGGSSPRLGVTDGSPDGTHLLPEYEFISTSNPFSGMVESGGRLLFAASRADVGSELWALDEVGGGPLPLTSLASGDVLQSFQWEHGGEVSGRALFWVSGPSSEPGTTHRVGLLASDGSPGGTSEIRTFPLDGSGDQRLFALGLLADAGLFQFKDGDRCGLWRTDGTMGGTAEFMAWDGYCPDAVFGSVSTDEHVYFSWGPPWVSDGTAAGTAELLPGSNLLNEVTFSEGTAVLPDGDLLFALTTYSAGTELWRSDGSIAGTHQVLDLTPAALSSTPSQLSAGGGRVVFFAMEDEHGNEPWASDGTPNGTRLIADFSEGESSSGISVLGYLDSAWPVMLRDNASPSPRIFLTSGDVGNLEEIESGDGVLQGSAFDQVRFAGRAIFTNTSEVWSTEQTPAAITRLAEGLYVGFDFLTDLVAGDRGVYFARKDGHAQNGLWITDGTPANTRLFCSAEAGLDFAFGNPTTEFRSGVAFVARGFDHLPEIWICDSEGSVARSLDLALQGVALSPALGASVGAELLFAATDTEGDRELWRSDGTFGGSQRVADLFAGGSSNPEGFVPFAGRALFVANDGIHGRELWISDGTAAGTMLVADLAPGRMSSSPADLRLSRGAVVFTAGSPTTGRELWVTAGTPESTRLLADANPGPASSAPAEITPTSGRIFFRATDSHGAELWAACPGWGAEAELAASIATEAAGSLALAVHLSVPAACGGGRFTLEVLSGSATANVDFVGGTREVAFAPGVVALELAVTLLDDSLPEDGETIRLILRDVLNRVVAESEVLIVDDDGGADADGDGIASLAEMQAPNGGDGNGDGLADALQPAVASYALAAPGAGVTIELGAGCTRLSGVEASLAEIYSGDPNHRFPHGLARFVAPDCAGTDVRVLLHGLPAADCASGVVRKALRRDPGTAGPDEWLSVSAAEVAELDLAGSPVCSLTFPVIDGGPGDLAPEPREIDDPVGLGVPTGIVDIPALSPGGVAFFALLLLSAGLFRVARSRGAESTLASDPRR